MQTDQRETLTPGIEALLAVHEAESVAALCNDDHSIRDFQTIREVRSLWPDSNMKTTGEPAAEIHGGSWDHGYVVDSTQDEYQCSCGFCVTDRREARNHLKRVVVARNIQTTDSEYSPLEFRRDEQEEIKPVGDPDVSLVVKPNASTWLWGTDIPSKIMGRVVGGDIEALLDTAREVALPDTDVLHVQCRDDDTQPVAQVERADTTIGLKAVHLEVALRWLADGGSYDMDDYKLAVTSTDLYLLAGSDETLALAKYNS